MRHTVTFDPDVDQSIKRLSKELGTSFKTLINDLLRKGIAASEERANDPLRIVPAKYGLKGDIPDLGREDEMLDEAKYG